MRKDYKKGETRLDQIVNTRVVVPRCTCVQMNVLEMKRREMSAFNVINCVKVYRVKCISSVCICMYICVYIYI